MNRPLHFSPTRKEIKDDLADWIDVDNLANEIIGAHEAYWPDLTLARCKELWLRALFNLADFLECEARHLPDPANED
ncbi:MAG: hypothetical protein R6V59_06335 [Dehalococcoidia bacterium]